MKKIVVIVLIARFAAVLTAQTSDYYAPGIDWKQIETKYFTVIFPPEITESAREVAGLVDYFYEESAASLKIEPAGRLPLILPGIDAISNGYVGLMPFRSVWFSAPGDFIGPTPWYLGLAQHEIRHRVQFEKLRNRLVYALGGELGWNLFRSLSAPLWLLEGDAVGVETVGSLAGRGRDPLFGVLMKALILERSPAGYHQIVNGSHQNPLPNSYALGFFLTSYIKNHYGAESLAVILEKISQVVIPVLGLRLGVEEATGLSLDELYEAMVAELRAKWKTQLEGLNLTPVSYLTDPFPPVYANYDSLTANKDGSFWARRNLWGQLSQLVKVSISGRIEEFETVPQNDRVSFVENLAAWVEVSSHPLYPVYDSKAILVKDLSTGQKLFSSPNGRFYNPALSKDGLKVAAFEITADLSVDLVVFDLDESREPIRFKIPDRLQAGQPSWSADGRKILFTITGPAGRALAEYNIQDKKYQSLIPFSYNNIQDPIYYDDGYLISSGYSGITNIYFISASGERFQITSRPYGAVKPALTETGHTLYFIEFYSVKGDAIAFIPLERDNWLAEAEIPIVKFDYFSGHIDSEPAKLAFTPEKLDKAAKEFPITPFDWAGNLFKPLAWGLWYRDTYDSGYLFDNDLFKIDLGFMGGDLFGVTNFKVGAFYDYDLQDEGGAIKGYSRGVGAFADFNLKAFYPQINLSFDYTLPLDTRLFDHQFDLAAYFGFPFDFSKGIWNSGLNFTLASSYQGLIANGANASEHRPFLSYYLAYNIYLDAPEAALYPEFGLYASLLYQHLLTQVDNDRFAARISLILPGLLPQTHLRFLTDYTGSQGILAAPGRLAKDLVGATSATNQTNSISLLLDYDATLWLPDADLGWFVYFKRLRLNLFYNIAFYSAGYSLPFRGPFTFDNWDSSFGLGLILDFTALDVDLYPFSLGIRLFYLIEQKTAGVQLLFADSSFFQLNF